MRILWMSSVQLSTQRTLISGTWIPGLFSLLKQYYPTLEIINLTKGDVSRATRVESNNLVEWIIPAKTKMTVSIINEIETVIKNEKPDIIQVWGTEDIWGTFPFQQKVPEIPAILEIQGILSSVSEEFYGGLTPMELFRCWNIKEFLKPSSSLPAIRRLYTKNIPRENSILRNFNNIGVQSEWSAAVVRTINRTARLYKSGIALRPPFYESDKWTIGDKNSNRIRIFSTALMGQPLKGAYILFKAFAIVKKRFPNAELVIAGVKEEGIRKSGFCRMLTRFAKKNGFIGSIRLLGTVNAKQLADQYRTASVFVNPSNWESYSVVTAEAMYIGCPTVASYSGAMPELGLDNSVLYFPKGDFRICASHIINILENSKLALELSNKSIIVGEYRQSRARIAEKQMETYLQLAN